MLQVSLVTSQSSLVRRFPPLLVELEFSTQASKKRGSPNQDLNPTFGITGSFHKVGAGEHSSSSSKKLWLQWPEAGRQAFLSWSLKIRWPRDLLHCVIQAYPTLPLCLSIRVQSIRKQQATVQPLESQYWAQNQSRAEFCFVRDWTQDLTHHR